MKRQGSTDTHKHDTAARRPLQRKEGELAASTRIEAPFAITTDGTLLINVASIEGCELEGRDLFVGVKLTGKERSAVGARLRNAIDELHAVIAGNLPKTQPAKKAG